MSSHTSTGVSHRKLGMWSFIGSECMLFGTLIATFLVYRSRNVVGPYPADLLNIPFIIYVANVFIPGMPVTMSGIGTGIGMAGFPVVMGGDHSIGLGVVSGAAAHAMQVNRPLFLLWLDAHSDFHTPLTTQSGNLHGTPVGYIAGRGGFDAFPAFPAPIPADRICLYGIRSVDPEEHAALLDHDIQPIDMRAIDEQGIVAPLRAFLDRVQAENGLLHVSLDVDFLDPSIAPAVGTTVPGGTTFREAHLVMELLHESGLGTSLDLVELNPFLDERGRTAKLMVDLVASLMGRKVFDRPTRSFT